jgi:hypothetical protein
MEINQPTPVIIRDSVPRKGIMIKIIIFLLISSPYIYALKEFLSVVTKRVPFELLMEGLFSQIMIIPAFSFILILWIGTLLSRFIYKSFILKKTWKIILAIILVLFYISFGILVYKLQNILLKTVSQGHPCIPNPELNISC